jgi:hypothetical protein
MSGLIYGSPLQKAQARHEIIAWVMLFSFLSYVIIHIAFQFIKVMREPVVFDLNDEFISMLYGNGRVDRVFWKDIGRIRSHRYWTKPGFETIAIIFKNGMERTLCNNSLREYKRFKVAIANIAFSNQVVTELNEGQSKKKGITRR